ncbi:hypothetical protein WR25_10127 [Diploscapter pachys]|uniref:Phosphorylase b kinase regulatory subunit n=1 Tax=Diploscapter pachys TaxID=2018661 RepID=A0A2A2LES1_9BILA|nr:hypothetical protein WR25_10127 [Diploscapter pachys]
MSGITLSRRRKFPPDGLKLRRLTQAYLAPYQQIKPEQTKAAARIDQIYDTTQHLLVRYQSATSGLFPRYSGDDHVGYVKDSIYCAIACWATSVAYKRLDDDRGRQTSLLQTAVKTMRGILFAWMQQCEELNNFKSNSSEKYALHARFDLQTGLALTQAPNLHHYGHLQMDLVAFYLLTMVQMIAAGVKVIYTHHEVNFVQNLVFYIERTYRTPDYGMWERGTRYNNGKPELHASSLGMVKAALEAINGFNLYGNTGNSASVIYVDIDGHNRNRTTFETILPRESNSKNTDASLLMTVGWPAFATHDENLFDKTVKKCVRHLEGKYGMKRFLRDGYRTELEDTTRAFYEEHETSQFQDIECQFPMFFALISLTGYIRGEQNVGDYYWSKFKSALVNDDSVPGGFVVPECYAVDELFIGREKKEPGSTELYALPHQDFGHHLLSNAIYIILMLKREGHIHSGDIDPIMRHLPASQRWSKIYFNRHSAFQGSMEGDPVVQIALITESSRLQMMLSTYGITSQTPHEVEPIQIWPSWRMVKVFECLGCDEKLGLSGRPNRPFGPLSTSKVFRVFGDTVLCYPLLFEVKDFYVNSDPAVLIDDVKHEIEFISRRWKLAGRPTLCLVLREENVLGEYFDHILGLLVQLKNGHVNGVRVRLGRVHQLLNSACIEHIDFAEPDDVEFDVSILEEADTNQPASRLSLKETDEDEHVTQQEISYKSTDELRDIVTKDDLEKPRQLAFAIITLWRRNFGGQMRIKDATLTERLEKVYRRACQLRIWSLVRICAGQLRKTINSLSPAITNMLVRGKQVTIGIGNREKCICRPISPSKLVDGIFGACPPDQPQIAVMQQELIIACSDLISHDRTAFDGVLTIRLSWLMDAISMLYDYVRESGTPLITNTAKTRSNSGGPRFPNVQSAGISKPAGTEFREGIFELAPTLVKSVVATLMTRRNWHLLSPLQTRRLNGALNRMPANFYDRMWTILERTVDGIVIASQYLPQQPTLSDMTRFELTFSYKIEETLSQIVHPEYRQLLVELLCIIATILERNPEISFRQGRLDCDTLIKRAFSLYADEQKIANKEDLTPFYQLENQSLTTSTATYLTKAIIEFILAERHFSQIINIFGEDVKNAEDSNTEIPHNDARLRKHNGGHYKQHHHKVPPSIRKHSATGGKDDECRVQ